MNALIEVRSGRIHLSTRSDSSGLFQLSHLPEKGTLSITAQGFSVASVSCCRFDRPLVIMLEPASIGSTIIVTAERQPTSISSTSANTVLLNAEEVNTPTSATLDDALRQVPGFTLFRRSSSLTANPTTQGAFARGLGANGASRILVLQDGIPLNDPFGGWVYWDRTPRLALTQAEVSRGAGSSLYGSAALAGVIDLISRPRGNLANLQIEGGGLGQRDAQAVVSHSSGSWTLSGAGEWFADNGAFVVTPEDRGAIDTPASLRFENGTVRVDRNLGTDARIFASGSLFSEERNNGTRLQINSTHLAQFTTGLEFSDGNKSVSLRFYGTGEKLHQSFSSISTDRDTETIVRWQTVPSGELGFSVQGSRIFPKFRVTAGIDGHFVHGESDETGFQQGAATALSVAGGTDRIIGAFAEFSTSPIRRLRISGGVRADEWSTDNSFSRTFSFTQSPNVINPVENHHESAVSPRIGLLYDLPASLQAIASVYGGFRAPTLNELYRSFRLGNVITTANPLLTAERLHGGEAGLRYVGSRFMLTGVFFRARVDDPVANVTQSVTPAVIMRQRENMGALQASGYDVESLLALKRFQLRSGYEYVHSEVTSFSADPLLVGKRLPQTPAHVFTETLIYSAPYGFALEALLRASSSQYDDDQNQFTLTPYSTVGLSVTKRLQDAELFGAVTNLFDSRIETAATPVTLIAPGRVVIGGLRLQFGPR